MPMKRAEFIATLREFDAANAVLKTGMPNSTEAERRAMRAKFRNLSEIVQHAPWQREKDGTVKER